MTVVLDRDPDELAGAARSQYEILVDTDVTLAHGAGALSDLAPETAVDAVVGYGLDGALRGTPARFAEWLSGTGATVVSLDVPSGLDATTGARTGPAVDPDRLVTLALPKTGLAAVEADLFLADIAIPTVASSRDRGESAVDGT